MVGCTATSDDGQGSGEGSTSTTPASTSTSSTSDDDPDSSSSSDATTTGMSSETTMSSEDTSTGSTTVSATSGAGFIYGAPDTTGESPIECSIFDQDCPAAEKCVLWANDGGDIWNAARCVPIDPEPSALGEPCTFEGSIYSGMDTCDAGSHCLPDEDGGRDGFCRAYCTIGDEDCEEAGTSCQFVQDPVAACLPD